MRRSIALALALLYGCSPSSGSPDGDGTESGDAGETGGPGSDPRPTPADPIPADQGAAAWAAELCGTEMECECEGFWDGQCENYTYELEYLFDEAASQGLTYDAQCMGDLVADLSWQACAGPDDPRATPCESWCSPWHGEAEAGAACSILGSAWIGGANQRAEISGCGQGLECADGVCTPHCETIDLPLGAQCSSGECVDGLVCLWVGGDWPQCAVLPEVGDACPDYLCASDAYCAFETYACEAWPTVGQTCQFGACAFEAYCGDDNVCVPDEAIGERCNGHSQCTSGYCPNGYCWPRPTEGEACAGPCTDGLICANAVCRPPAAVCGE